MRREPPRREAIAHIDHWVFDLDNTLYHPRVCDLFGEMVDRMTIYVAEYLSLDLEAAAAERRRLSEAHGTTMRGLIVERGIEPAAFLEFVHDVDLALVVPDPALDRAIGALPGRKVVFTSATVKHATAVMDRIGITRHFDIVFDVVAARHVPKPNADTYRCFLEHTCVRAEQAAMFEDMAKNLAPAAALGMTTVWVENDRPSALPLPEDTHIHYVTDDLVGWLEAAVR